MHGIAQLDQSWMNESHMSPEYEDDVEQFLQFASEIARPNEEGKYYCPCINYLNRRRQLILKKRNYTCTKDLCIIRGKKIGVE